MTRRIRMLGTRFLAPFAVLLLTFVILLASEGTATATPVASARGDVDSKIAGSRSTNPQGHRGEGCGKCKWEDDDYWEKEEPETEEEEEDWDECDDGQDTGHVGPQKIGNLGPSDFMAPFQPPSTQYPPPGQQNYAGGNGVKGGIPRPPPAGNSGPVGWSPDASKHHPEHDASGTGRPGSSPSARPSSSSHPSYPHPGRKVPLPGGPVSSTDSGPGYGPGPFAKPSSSGHPSFPQPGRPVASPDAPDCGSGSGPGCGPNTFPKPSSSSHPSFPHPGRPVASPDAPDCGSGSGPGCGSNTFPKPSSSSHPSYPQPGRPVTSPDAPVPNTGSSPNYGSGPFTKSSSSGHPSFPHPGRPVASPDAPDCGSGTGCGPSTFPKPFSSSHPSYPHPGRPVTSPDAPDCSSGSGPGCGSGPFTKPSSSGHPSFPHPGRPAASPDAPDCGSGSGPGCGPSTFPKPVSNSHPSYPHPGRPVPSPNGPASGSGSGPSYSPNYGPSSSPGHDPASAPPPSAPWDDGQRPISPFASAPRPGPEGHSPCSGLSGGSACPPGSGDPKRAPAPATKIDNPDVTGHIPVHVDSQNQPRVPSSASGCQDSSGNPYKDCGTGNSEQPGQHAPWSVKGSAPTGTSAPKFPTGHPSPTSAPYPTTSRTNPYGNGRPTVPGSEYGAVTPTTPRTSSSDSGFPRRDYPGNGQSRPLPVPRGTSAPYPTASKGNPYGNGRPTIPGSGYSAVTPSTVLTSPSDSGFPRRDYGGSAASRPASTPTQTHSPKPDTGCGPGNANCGPGARRPNEPTGKCNGEDGNGKCGDGSTSPNYETEPCDHPAAPGVIKTIPPSSGDQGSFQWNPTNPFLTGKLPAPSAPGAYPGSDTPFGMPSTGQAFSGKDNPFLGGGLNGPQWMKPRPDYGENLLPTDGTNTKPHDRGNPFLNVGSSWNSNSNPNPGSYNGHQGSGSYPGVKGSPSAGRNHSGAFAGSFASSSSFAAAPESSHPAYTDSGVDPAAAFGQAGRKSRNWPGAGASSGNAGVHNGDAGRSWSANGSSAYASAAASASASSWSGAQ